MRWRRQTRAGRQLRLGLDFLCDRWRASLLSNLAHRASSADLPAMPQAATSLVATRWAFGAASCQDVRTLRTPGLSLLHPSHHQGPESYVGQFSTPIHLHEVPFPPVACLLRPSGPALEVRHFREQVISCRHRSALASLYCPSALAPSGVFHRHSWLRLARGNLKALWMPIVKVGLV